MFSEYTLHDKVLKGTIDAHLGVENTWFWFTLESSSKSQMAGNKIQIIWFTRLYGRRGILWDKEEEITIQPENTTLKCVLYTCFY